MKYLSDYATDWPSVKGYSIIIFIDVDYCKDTSCNGVGTCLSHAEGFTCTCNQGYSGDKCETGK